MEICCKDYKKKFKYIIQIYKDRRMVNKMQNS